MKYRAIIPALMSLSISGCTGLIPREAISTPADGVALDTVALETSDPGHNDAGAPPPRAPVAEEAAAPADSLTTRLPPAAPIAMPALPSDTAVHEDTPAYTSLWSKLRDGFELPHEVDRKRVQNEINWFKRHPDYVRRVANRAAPHLSYIVDQIQRRGLPMEFALLPIVESAYDPFAYSHGRAAGLWQFIPGTARVYGLRIDWWYDGRRDVRASTDAAIDYLTYLNQLFHGDWLLALAAYNAGQGNVINSIRASGQRRSEADFWTLKVLRETYTYVPRLLAISAIFAEPEKYGITLPELGIEPYWEVVQIEAQIDLHKAATLAGISVDEMYSLNAGYNQWATHPRGPHELIVPAEAAPGFREQLAQLPPEERVSWERHEIRSGESLGTIARDYNTTIATIRSVNNLRGNMIRTGDSLMIPSAANNVDYHMTAAGRLASKQEKLAERYGTEPIRYEVQPGDSFWDISRKFDVGMRELARWNGMGTSSLLYPGTELVLYRRQPAAPGIGDLVGDIARSQGREQVRKLNYRVREGESLSVIAAKFNITVQKIRAWNKAISVNKYIHPGDRLTLYVDVTSLIN